MAKKKKEDENLEEQKKKIEIEREEEETEEAAEETEEPAEEAEETAEEEEPEEEEAEAAAEEKPEKGGFFKKKKDKREELIEELQDRVKRQMAEFENFRKRNEREKSQSFELGAKSVIEKMLPVIDNFERGLAAVPEEQKGDPFVDGMDKIYKQLLTELENLGVKPIEAVGKEFDPEFHNAVMQVESDEYESGIVAQEMQKGYLFRDSVVRHSMVAVVS
jgi:molecular chaperone GrpE